MTPWTLGVGLAALVAGLVAAAPAAAAPRKEACSPLEEGEFRSYVLDAQSAIDRGDVDVPAAILSELDARIPCLTFAPAPRMWAEMLVARAIVEFSRGGDWQDPLAGALRIRPAIDRGVGAGHPLAHWQPPPPPPPGPALPQGVRLYVDGFPSQTAPPAQGLYLVQKTDGRFWNSMILDDAELPPGWAESAVEQPARLIAWGRIGLIAGYGSFKQDSSWESDVYPDTTDAIVRAGLSGDLQATFFSPFGLRARVTGTLGPTVWADGWLAAAFAPRGWTLGAGVGSVSVTVFENDYGPAALFAPTASQRVRQLRYPMGTVGLRSMAGARWDAQLTVGASSAVVRYEAAVGLLLPPIGRGRYRIGLTLDGRRGVFVESAPDIREVTLSGAVGGLELDLVQGDY